MTPFLTIVMPVRNEARFIRVTLQRLLTQDYPADWYEIIVADGMSDDGTREIVLELAREHPQLRLLDNPKRLSSAGRNVGFKTGRGDYFLVVDGHCHIPDDQLFRNVVACFEKSGADCLGRPQPLDPPGLTAFQKAVAVARASRLGHGGGSLIFDEFEGFASPVSHGAVYSRHVFDMVGYVDETFDAAEDIEFNYRVEHAGLRCYTSPTLAIRYYPRENLRGLFSQMVRYGKGRRKFIRKHPQALTVNQLIPSVFVIGIVFMLFSLGLYFSTGLVAPLLIAVFPYLVYLLLLGAVSVTTSRQYGLMCALPVSGIIFVIHSGLGWGFLKETIGALCSSSTVQLSNTETSGLLQ